MNKTKNTFLLLLTAFIWGVAFVAQSVGMDYVGPLTFNASRFIIGAIFLIPCIAFLDKLKEKGVIITDVTLHIGLGTFKPMDTENIEDHIMHSEFYMMSKETSDILNKAKELGNNFSIIDFLTLTNYSFDEITQAGDQILDPNDAKLLRIYVSNFKSIKNYSDKAIQNIFIDKLVINIDGNLSEMSLEDKEKIVSFLKEHDIPISSTSYRDATIRYYNNTLFASPSK